jgi:dCMP deaminase
MLLYLSTCLCFSSTVKHLQVGACIVDGNNVILGIGYNGFPRGCRDDQLPWAKKSESNDILQTKYPYVVHAEANALLNKNAAKVDGAVCPFQ